MNAEYCKLAYNQSTTCKKNSIYTCANFVFRGEHIHQRFCLEWDRRMTNASKLEFWVQAHANVVNEVWLPVIVMHTTRWRYCALANKWTYVALCLPTIEKLCLRDCLNWNSSYQQHLTTLVDMNFDCCCPRLCETSVERTSVSLATHG